jgi:hypothetical protein
MAKGDEIATEVEIFVQRDRQGSSSPWQHCNLCPLADSQPCVRSCAALRDETARQDGIKVSY